MLDVIERREMGRKFCLIAGIPCTNLSFQQGLGEKIKSLQRENGHFLVKIPVDLRVLPRLGVITAWYECLSCKGSGYTPLRFLPFLYRLCKECKGKRGHWGETD